MRKVRRRALGASIESLEKRNLLTFAIDLFQDINLLGVSSQIDSPIQMGNETFFVADDGITGSELWKTDGTEAGTMLVKDILPDSESSDPADFAMFGGELFFTALDEVGETDLWKTDGTESGTVKVFDADQSGVFYLRQLTASGGNLFFTAYEYDSGYELWKSDGTAAGTQLVLDINPDKFIIDGPRDLIDVDGTLFFTSYESGYDNRELWSSDGTAAGTMMVKDLFVDPGDDGIPGTPDDDPSFSSYPMYLTNVNGTLFFVAEDFDGGIELFKSDGTEAGTMMVQDLNVGSGSSYPDELTSFSNQLFFVASDGDSGRQLYKSDGASITLVADTAKGLEPSSPSGLEVVGSELFFAANGAIPATTVSANRPLLTGGNSTRSGGFAGIVAQTSSDFGGTIATFNDSGNFSAVAQCCSLDGPGWVADTARIGDAGVGLSQIEVGDLYIQSVSGGDLSDYHWEWTIEDAGGISNIDFSGFFSANQMDNETNEGLVFELFLNDDTVRTSVQEIRWDDTTVIGQFGLDDFDVGDQLDNWLVDRDADNLDLTHPGGETITKATVRLSLGVLDGNGDVVEMHPNGGSEAFLINASLTADLSPAPELHFPAGRELHKTDGTEAGTMLIKDIVPLGDSSPSELKAAGGKLFFSADDVTDAGRELWVSDGTEAGTMRLIDSLPGNDLYGAPLDGNPEVLGALGSMVLFTTEDAASDRELWKSDGTELGTELVKDINPATEDADVRRLNVDGNLIYFQANDGVNGEAIWVADTTATLPQDQLSIFHDVSPSGTDRVEGLTLIPGAEEGSLKPIWYNNSLGTAGGVYTLNDIGEVIQISPLRPFELNDAGDMFIAFQSNVYFVADDGSSGEEIWGSDRVSPASLAIDLVPGAAGSMPRELTLFRDSLYFVAEDPTYGREVFFLNDESGIATVLADIDPNADSSDPDQLTVSGDDLYFTANDGSNGRELWVSNGNGTSMTTNLASGNASSFPNALADAEGVLYFGANNGSTGFEPYSATDGVVASVGDLNPGLPSSNPNGFFSALGSVFFAADDGTDGSELWKTNGTTERVADIRSGSESSSPLPLFNTGLRLLFGAAEGGQFDRELWATDGTEGKTLLVDDFFPGPFLGSDPQEMIDVGGTIYFIADSPYSGRELFTLTQHAPSVDELFVGGVVEDPPQEDPQRSSVDLVRVTFDGRIDVPDGAVTLHNRTTGVDLTSVQTNTVWENGQTILELTFGSGVSVVDRDPGGTTGLGNSLADGNYELTLDGSLVSSAVSGVPIGNDFVHGAQQADAFFRLFGDTDGNRVVDGADLANLASSFLQTSGSPGYNKDLDVDGDGDVDGADQLQVHLRLFGRM